jgi:hypothetical protein
MSTDNKLLKSFISFFPPVEAFPMTVTQADAGDYEKLNPALPPVLINGFISPFDEDQDDDEFTEYIPCFSLPTKGFHAVVWWRASLLDYRFEVATYKADGSPIEVTPIAGLSGTGDLLIEEVATFHDVMTIITSTGKSTADGSTFEPSETLQRVLKLNDDGTHNDQII